MSTMGHVTPEQQKAMDRANAIKSWIAGIAKKPSALPVTE